MKNFPNHHNITVDSGFSDKLRIITFFLALKKLNNNQNKIINFADIKTRGCPYRFADNFTIKNLKIRTVNKKIDSFFNLNPFNSQINLRNCRLHNIYKKIDNNKLLSHWKKAYIDIAPNKKIKNRY